MCECLVVGPVVGVVAGVSSSFAPWRRSEASWPSSRCVSSWGKLVVGKERLEVVPLGVPRVQLLLQRLLRRAQLPELREVRACLQHLAVKRRHLVLGFGDQTLQLTRRQMQIPGDSRPRHRSNEGSIETEG